MLSYEFILVGQQNAVFLVIRLLSFNELLGNVLEQYSKEAKTFSKDVIPALFLLKKDLYIGQKLFNINKTLFNMI